MVYPTLYRVVNSHFFRRLFLILLMVLLIGIVYAVILSAPFNIHNVSAVKHINVQVYSDSGCTQLLTLIDWGIVEPSGTVNHTAYIKNTSNVPVTLTVYTENWIPSNASNFISLTTYDLPSNKLGKGDTCTVVFSLYVSPTISGIENFSFDIVVVGSG